MQAELLPEPDYKGYRKQRAQRATQRSAERAAAAIAQARRLGLPDPRCFVLYYCTECRTSTCQNLAVTLEPGVCSCGEPLVPYHVVESDRQDSCGYRIAMGIDYGARMFQTHACPYFCGWVRYLIGDVHVWDCYPHWQAARLADRYWAHLFCVRHHGPKPNLEQALQYARRIADGMHYLYARELAAIDLESDLGWHWQVTSKWLPDGTCDSWANVKPWPRPKE